MIGNHPRLLKSLIRTKKTRIASIRSIHTGVAEKFLISVSQLQRSCSCYFPLIIFLLLISGNRFGLRAQARDSADHIHFFLSYNGDKYLIADLSEVTFIGSFSSEEKSKQYYRTVFRELLESELHKKNIRFVKDTLSGDVNSPATPDSISALLTAFSCNWYVFPASCTITKKIIQKPGWRNNRSGPSYERPEETELKTVLEMVMFNNEGKIQFRVNAEGKSRRPFMYNVFSRFSKKERIEKYANSLYAPPELKSLYKAIKSLCSDQSSGM